MKKLLITILVAILTLSLIACGEKSEGKKNTSSGPKYAFESANCDNIDPYTYPEDYPLIAGDDFEASFKKMEDANMKGEIKTYQDVVAIYESEGVYFENCDKESNGVQYKYYGWFSDSNGFVLITFKADKDNLEYFAYTGWDSN
ncbi:MAG: hypothetical protein GXY98_00040 [Erysipelothrix sp.]|jgi:uncharacterized lipoprotein YehR (DUF1307 family)|nr:hypothetical protein [Erysipelothrix sp.]NLY82441.1 hypothetical protein [Clostridiales bacterium]